jgi:biopolymer transport protein ExbD
MPVNLPKSATATDRSPVRTVVTVTQTGNYYIDKQQVVFEEIQPVLSARLKDNPKMVVVINCDKGQHWGRGIEVMDEAKRAGAEILTIATEPKVRKG